MSVRLLKLIVGIFFVLLGISGVFPNIGESIFSLNNKNLTIEIAFGIVEIICGVVILYGIFVTIQRKAVYHASMIVFLFWIARIVLSKFIWGKPAVFGASGFITWLLIISAELVIATSVLVLARTYNKRGVIND